jgi:hypothetical protein
MMAVTDALLPGDARNHDPINPLGVEALRPVLDLLGVASIPASFVILFAAAASLVVRVRRSSLAERQQIKWPAYAAAAIPVWFAINTPIEAANHVYFPELFFLRFGGVVVWLRVGCTYRQRYYPWAHRRCNDRV